MAHRWATRQWRVAELVGITPIEPGSQAILSRRAADGTAELKEHAERAPRRRGARYQTIALYPETRTAISGSPAPSTYT